MNLGIICLFIVIAIFIFIILSILKVLLQSSKLSLLWKQTHPSNDDRINTIEEPLNLVGMLILLIFELVLILVKVGFEFDGSMGDLPGLVFTIIPIFVLLFFFGYNIYKYTQGHSKQHTYGVENEKERVSHSSKRKIDFRRKMWHFVAFLILSIFLLIGGIWFRTYITDPKGSSEYNVHLAQYWGTQGGLEYLSIAFIRHTIPLGQVIMIMVMYGMMIILLLLEITRLSKFVHCVFHKESQKRLLYKEIDSFASYSHFAVGYLAAAMILPPMLFLGAMCLATFADPAASIIGMKYGKHKLPWGEKSVEGLIAGGLAALITMIPFVGIIYALFGMLVFLAIDLLTPVKIKVSDNLLLPIIIVIVFAVLSFLNIPSINVFGV